MMRIQDWLGGRATATVDRDGCRRGPCACPSPAPIAPEIAFDDAKELIGVERPAAVADLVTLSMGERPEIVGQVVLARHQARRGPGPE